MIKISKLQIRCLLEGEHRIIYDFFGGLSAFTSDKTGGAGMKKAGFLRPAFHIVYPVFCRKVTPLQEDSFLSLHPLCLVRL